MKKFSLLAVGEAFEYQGERYTKSGPLTASRANGTQRMIPRSAVVETRSGTTPPPAKVESKSLPVEQVIEAFENYHKGCQEWLAMTEKVDQELAATIRQAMEAAREKFLAELNRL
jgi:hypothetical protein